MITLTSSYFYSTKNVPLRASVVVILWNLHNLLCSGSILRTPSLFDHLNCAPVPPFDLADIMEYGSTPYVGMALKEMAAVLNVYKMVCP